MTIVNFWWVMTVAVMVWFSTITVYVAVRGAFDIKHMLARLKDNKDRADQEQK